jgi:hypothetical protein
MFIWHLPYRFAAGARRLPLKDNQLFEVFNRNLETLKKLIVPFPGAGADMLHYFHRLKNSGAVAQVLLFIFGRVEEHH